MIATPAQYEIAQDRIRRFGEALDELAHRAASWLRDLQLRDIRDQIDSLEGELARYDELVSGAVEEIVVERLADLPRALVQARIVTGLTPIELARASGQSRLKIEQWERDGYSRVPVEVMRRIALVLPIRLSGVAAPGVGARPSAPLRRILTQAGLPKEVYDTAIVPTQYEGPARDDEIDRRLEKLFGSGAAAFVQRGGFEPVPLRFKLPANAAQERTRAYASYVDGVCSLVATTQPRRTSDLPPPQDWRVMRGLLFPDGAVDLETAVRQCWAHGIGVIGLLDKVAFHGAARRVDGRATVVLKPSSRHASRWLFNLVHEIYHLVSEPEDFTLLEGNETSRYRREDQNERRADRYAALVLTDGTLEEAFAMVQRRAGGGLGRRSEGDAARLVASVRETAGYYRIPVGILANLVAEDLRSNGRVNWWGAANNLQPLGDDPWKVVRDLFLQEADLRALGGTAADLLQQILETRDE